MGLESIYKLSSLVNMIDRIKGPSAAIGQAVEKNVSQFQEYSHNMAAIARDGTALIDTGYQIASAAVAPVQATFETQDALAALASLGSENLQVLESAAKSFSDQWAGTSKPDFLNAAYDIKSGIADLTDEGVAQYTTLAGVTAKATKATIGEMASLFATGYGIYKDYYAQLSDLEFGEMFSAGIASSIRVFKTSGSGMAQAISALGGTATSANVPLEEQLSILGMLQATMSGSEAGTTYADFLNNAAKAGQELGLNFTDATGQLRSMPEVLGLIKGKFGETLTAADKLELEKAFGTVEAVKLIDRLYSKTDTLQDNILSLYDSMRQGMNITEEMAGKVNAPPGQQWILLKQKIQDTKETIGNAMLPTFIKLQEIVSGVADKFAAFTEKHPELISSILYAIAAFGGFLMLLGISKFAIVAVGVGISGLTKVVGIASKALWAIKNVGFLVQYGAYGLKLALGPLGKGFRTMAGSVKTAMLGMLAWVKRGIMSAISALPGLIGSVWSFTAALLANPITWVVIGIIALIAVIILLWRNWDSVTAWMSSAWQKFTGGLGEAFDRVRSMLTGVPDWVLVALAAFMPFIGIPLLVIKHWDKIKEFFSGLPQWFADMGAKIVQGLVNGIKLFAAGPGKVMKGALGKVRALLPFSDAKTGPLSDLTLSGQRVFETFDAGMRTTADLPAETMQEAFAGMEDWNPGGAGISMMESRSPAKQTIIQRLILNVDLSSIEELKKLKLLLAEIEDETNRNPEIRLAGEGAQ